MSECCQCLRIGYWTVALLAHSIVGEYKRAPALSVETEYAFRLAKNLKAFLPAPYALGAAAPAALAPSLPFLLLQPPQPRLKPRESWRNQMRIGDLVLLTDPLKGTNPASLI
ncbi:hypothetical protein ACRRTK_020729 [Alexandromys fortis]